MWRHQNYEEMTNKKLIEIAESKGIPVTPAIYNRLNVFRGVMDDHQGHQDRQDFISRIRAIDNQKNTRLAIVIAVASLAITTANFLLRG